MSLSYRRILFAIFFLIFIIVGAGVIFYTQGYRVDFSNLAVTRTGAVYIEANVQGYSVYLGKSVYPDKSGILKKGTLISDVIPKKYRLVIKKDGYIDYEKNIEVLPMQVVRLFNVNMVSSKTSSTELINGVKGDVISDVDQNNHVLTLDNQKNIYYLYDTGNPSAAAINMNSRLSAITRQKITGLWFYPQTSNIFIAQTAKGVYKLDLDSKTMTTIQEGVVSDIKIDGNNMYIIIQNTASKTIDLSSSAAPSKVVIYDLILGSKITEFMLPFQSKQITDMDSGNNTVALLLSDGSLFLYDNSGKQLSQIAYLAKRMSISDDKSKIFFQDNDGKTFVYLFDDEISSLGAPKGSTIHLELVDISHINNIWWYPDSFHLIIAYPDKIYLAEVTTMDPNNRFPIANAQGYNFYSQQNKTIYNLNSGDLSSLDISGI